MGTKFRRLNIVLDPDTDRVIVDLSRLTKRPQAAIIRELMREATPALAETVAALSLAATSPQRAVDRMVAMSDRVVAGVNQLTLGLRRKQGRPRKRG